MAKEESLAKGVWSELQDWIWSSSEQSTIAHPKFDNIEVLNNNVFEVRKQCGNTDGVDFLGKASTSRPSLDVVFFHGLQLEKTDAPHLTTWLSRDKSECWLNWLHDEIPNARILTVSYDAASKETDTEGRMDMFQVAENLVTSLAGPSAGVGQSGCPVVLVGHCLGGLVMKEVCDKANGTVGRGSKYDHQDLQNFLDSVKGFFYYSTPHHGVHLPKTLSSRTGPLVQEFNIFHPPTARRNEHFRALRQKFRWKAAALGENYNVDLKSFGGFSFAVPEASTRCDIDDGGYYTVGAHHFDVCRPVNKKCASFYRLRDFLRKCLEMQPVSSPERPKFTVGLDGSKGWESSKPDITFGGQRVVDDLITALISRRYPWIVLSGMGGVGKTHTAREMFHDEKVCSHFSGGMFWITIGKDKPKTHAILQTLFEQISEKEELKTFPRNTEDAAARVKGILHDRTDLIIILDDVWHPDIVECFAKILEEHQGVILVTTRDQGNVRWVASDAKFIDVPVLSKTDSWELFKSYAFPKKPDVPPELQTVAREVAEECKGLPLALRVIGSTMRVAQVVPKERNATLRSKWEDILEKLRNARCYDDTHKELFLKLQLSIDHLVKEDPRLFHCFSYFAAFCEDEGISDHLLAEYWIAEGLIIQENADWKSERKDAKALFDTLLRTSVIEAHKDRDDEFTGNFVIHDVLRDLAHQNLKWDFLKEGEILPANRECLYAPGLMSTEFPREWFVHCSSSWEVFKGSISPRTSNQLRAKRMSLHGSRVSSLPSNFNAPNLRVLPLSDNEGLSALPPGFFNSLSNLTVLDLSGSGIQELSAGVLRALKKLRFLDLSFCSHLRRISNEINGLENLNVLLIQRCYELEVFPRVESLKKLNTFGADLDIPRYGLNWRHMWSNYLTYCGIGGIQELFRWNILKELYLVSHYCHDVFTPDSVRALEFLWTRALDVSSLRALEFLCIRGIPLPTGVMNLRNLKKLSVDSRVLDVHMPALDELPLLEELDLLLPETAVLPSSFGSEKAFPSLKVITLTVRKLFTICEGTMPKIESVTINLDKLEEYPASLRNLHTVVSLHVLGCSERHVRSVLNLLKEKDCFPCLEHLEIISHFGMTAAKWQSSSSDLGQVLHSLPRLRTFRSDCPNALVPVEDLDIHHEFVVEDDSEFGGDLHFVPDPLHRLADENFVGVRPVRTRRPCRGTWPPN